MRRKELGTPCDRMLSHGVPSSLPWCTVQPAAPAAERDRSAALALRGVMFRIAAWSAAFILTLAGCERQQLPPAPANDVGKGAERDAPPGDPQATSWCRGHSSDGAGDIPRFGNEQGPRSRLPILPTACWALPTAAARKMSSGKQRARFLLLPRRMSALPWI